MFAGHNSYRFCKLLEQLVTRHRLCVDSIGCANSLLNNILFYCSTLEIKSVVRFITHLHLAPKLKKEQNYTHTPPLGFYGLFQSELYLLRTLSPNLSICHFYLPNFQIMLMQAINMSFTGVLVYILLHLLCCAVGWHMNDVLS